MHQVSEDAVAEVASVEQLARMLADLCQRVEQGYDPVMIARVKGLGEWWAVEKARQKAADQLAPNQTETLRGHYRRLTADFVSADPDHF